MSDIASVVQEIVSVAKIVTDRGIATAKVVSQSPVAKAVADQGPSGPPGGPGPAGPPAEVGFVELVDGGAF